MAYGDNYRSLMRPASLRKERDYTRADDGKFSETSGGGGSKAKEQPKEAPKAPAERAPAEQRTAALEATGLSTSQAEAFDELAIGAEEGEEIALSPANKQALQAAGLVDETGKMTDKGKAVAEASRSGDAEGAKAAAGDKPADKKPTGEGVGAGSAADKDKLRGGLKPDDKKPKEEKKPKGGKGGGGGAKKPDDKDKEKAKAEEKEKAEGEKAKAKADATAAAAGKAGISADSLNAMRSAAEGGKVDAKQAKALVAAGLMADTPDGPQLTSAGRKALTSLERGDARGAVAARQEGKAKARDAQAKGEKAKAKADKEKAKADLAGAKERREREMLSPWLNETKMLKRAGLPYGFGAYSLGKHR